MNGDGVEHVDFMNLVRGLIHLIAWGDGRAMQDASLQVAMLLELNVRPVDMPSNPEFYVEVLAEPLRARPLREVEEVEIIRELMEALSITRRYADFDFRADYRASGILYALGRAHPWTALETVLQFISTHGTSASETVIHQAVFSLRNLLDWGADHPRFPEIRRALDAVDVSEVFHEIVRRSWVDPSVNVDAEHVLERLEELRAAEP